MFVLNRWNGHRAVFLGDLLKNCPSRDGQSERPVSELTRIRGLIQHVDKMPVEGSPCGYDDWRSKVLTAMTDPDRTVAL